MNQRPHLTTGQIAGYCYVSKSTVLKWIKAGRLKAYTIPGGFHRIEREDFRAFLLNHGMPIRQDFFDTGTTK